MLLRESGRKVMILLRLVRKLCGDESKRERRYAQGDAGSSHKCQNTDKRGGDENERACGCSCDVCTVMGTLVMS